MQAIHWKRNTAVFLGGQMISLFGSALVQYAITWHITLTTQSGLYMSLAILCGFIPTFLLSPFAGVWADRYNRKTLIMVSDGSIAVTTLILALSIMLGYNAIWPLFVALGIRALGAAVQMPCVGAILPSIVPEEHLTRVNGINSTAQSLITLASPVLSAALLKTTPFSFIFMIDVGTAALAIGIMLLFFQLPKREPPAGLGSNNYFGELKLGISYVWNTKFLRHFFLYLAIFYFLFSPAAFLTPLQITRNFGEDEFYLMAIEVAFSVGMAVGGIVISVWGGFRNRIHSMGLACVVLSLCTIVLGLPITLWLYLAVMALFGLSMPIYSTPAMVMLQERVDPDYMGRVFGVMTMISSSIMPIGMLAFGPLADQIPIEWLLLGTGALMLALTMIFTRDQHLKKAGMKL